MRGEKWETFQHDSSLPTISFFLPKIIMGAALYFLGAVFMSLSQTTRTASLVDFFKYISSVCLPHQRLRFFYLRCDER